MRVLVHAGMPKTGSSAIQKYLSEQRGSLRGIDVHYPDFGYKNHWPLGFVLGEAEARNYLNRRAHKGGRDEDIRRMTLDTIRQTIDAGSDESWLVLSHESLGIKTLTTNLRALLTTNESPIDVAVIAYVRPPPTHFPSEMQQMLKSGNTAFPGLTNWTLVHSKRAANLREIFGEGTYLRVFSPQTLINGDVVEDFRLAASQLVGRELPKPQADVVANVSYTGPACALLLQYVERGQETGKPYRILRKALSQFQEGRSDAKLRLPTDWHARFGAESSAAWNSLIAAIPMDARIRNDLELSHAQGETTVSGRDVADWIRSYANPAFDAAFAAFCRAEEGNHKASWKHIVAWIESRGGAA